MDQELTERFLELEGDVLQLQKERIEDLKVAVKLEDFKRVMTAELRAVKKEQARTSSKLEQIKEILKALANR